MPINNNKIWSHEISELITHFDSNIETGLTEHQAEELLRKNGLNKLPEAKKTPWWKIILLHFIEPFMFVLFTLLIVLGYLQKWPEFFAVIIIILIETSLGSYQEIKAQKSLDALKKLVTETATVLRDGKKQTIAVKNIVVGDIIVLEAGMFIPADLRIIKSFNLRTNESLLTGESELVTKTLKAIKKNNLGISDRKNMAFMSTIVGTGSGLGIVVATALDSEIGKITKLLQNEKFQKSPLQKQITSLSRIISIFALCLAIIMLIIQRFWLHKPFLEGLPIAIAIAVSVIPEALSVIVSVTLALATNRMAKKHAIVKQLTAVETLGQVNVICSDKTGTLTQNKMTVRKYFLTTNVEESSNFNYHQNLQTKLFLDCLILANNGSTSGNQGIGDPTETSLLFWAKKLKLSPKKVQKTHYRIFELPFDSQRKLMSTINNYENKTMIFVKGAPEKLLARCNYALIANKKVKITAEIKTDITSQIHKMSAQALRVLAAAYKETSNNVDFNNIDKIENNLIFLGLTGVIDPPRQELKSVLKRTEVAGIATKMITGDHENTAFAIGQELNLISTKDQLINGEEIEQLTDAQLAKIINNYQIFARVSPEHKVRIVKALQKQGNAVAMTGDGVNDAPSLKAANIGIAMGITGTDVAKEAAQLVLTDDNFLTIVDAVEEGRNIYSKLKRIICFIIITNLIQVIAILIGVFIHLGDILTPIQILWINIIVESILAVSLSLGPNNPKLMQQKPINKKENLLTGSWWFILVISALLSSLLIMSYLFLPKVIGEPSANGHIYTFIIMVNAPLFYCLSFAVGRNSFIFDKLVFKNKVLFAAIFISLILNSVIIFVPFINKSFGIETNISFISYLLCLLIATIPLLCIEAIKLIRLIWKTKVNKKTVHYY